MLKLIIRIINYLILLFTVAILISVNSFNSSFENSYEDSSLSYDFLKTMETSTASISQKQTINENNKILTQSIFDPNNKIPNQYIVVYKNNVKDVNSLTDQLSTKIQANSLLPPNISPMKVIDTFDKSVKGAVVKISDVYNLLDIRNDPNVLYVEQDQKVFPFVQQIPKGINRIDADLSYAISGNGAGTINADIAIIDSGISYNHPDLNIYKRIDFTGGTSLLVDDIYGHGSHVAGIAAAKDNSVGVVGVASGARLWNLKVLDIQVQVLFLLLLRH